MRFPSSKSSRTMSGSWDFSGMGCKPSPMLIQVYWEVRCSTDTDMWEIIREVELQWYKGDRLWEPLDVQSFTLTRFAAKNNLFNRNFASHFRVPVCGSFSSEFCFPITVAVVNMLLFKNEKRTRNILKNGNKSRKKSKVRLGFTFWLFFWRRRTRYRCDVPQIIFFHQSQMWI